MFFCVCVSRTRLVYQAPPTKWVKIKRLLKFFHLLLSNIFLHNKLKAKLLGKNICKNSTLIQVILTFLLAWNFSVCHFDFFKFIQNKHFAVETIECAKISTKRTNKKSIFWKNRKSRNIQKRSKYENKTEIAEPMVLALGY